MKITILVSTLAASSGLISSVPGVSAGKQWITPTSVTNIKQDPRDKTDNSQGLAIIRNTKGNNAIDSYIAFQANGYPGKTCKLEFPCNNHVAGGNGMTATVSLANGPVPKSWRDNQGNETVMGNIRIKVIKPVTQWEAPLTLVDWGDGKPPPTFDCPSGDTYLTYHIFNSDTNTDISWPEFLGLQLSVN